MIFSCETKNVEKGWRKVKNTHSIEKYQNYLINHPQTVHSLEIRDSLRVFWDRYAREHWNQCDWAINTLTLIVDKQGQYFLNDNKIDKSKLLDNIEYSVSNPFNSVLLPSKKEVEIEDLGIFEVSRGVLNITVDRELDTQAYSDLLIILRKSYQRMRDECAIHLYERSLEELNMAQRANIETIVPMRIRIECPTSLPDLSLLDSLPK